MGQELVKALQQSAGRYIETLDYLNRREETDLESDMALLDTVLRDFHRVASPHAVLALCSAVSDVTELSQKLADAQHEIRDLKDILASAPPLQMQPNPQQEAS